MIYKQNAGRGHQTGSDSRDRVKDGCSYWMKLGMSALDLLDVPALAADWTPLGETPIRWVIPQFNDDTLALLNILTYKQDPR